MSKKVRVKKTIDLYKTPLSAPIVALFGMIAFLFVNIDNISNFKLAVISVGIMLNCVAIVGIIWHYMNNLNRLENL